MMESAPRRPKETVPPRASWDDWVKLERVSGVQASPRKTARWCEGRTQMRPGLALPVTMTNGEPCGGASPVVRMAARASARASSAERWPLTVTPLGKEPVG